MATAQPILVLIVDHHRMVAESIAHTLSREPDIEVVGVVEDPEEATQRALAEEPDVLLVADSLALEAIIATTASVSNRSSRTKVVILTSVEDEAVLGAAVEAGCRGFVSQAKPLAELVDAVRSVHDGETPISASLLERVLPRLSRGYRPLGSDLTSREREVLELIAQGLSTTDIAERLVLSPSTVRNHVQHVLQKLDAHSRVEAVAVARQVGILPLI